MNTSYSTLFESSMNKGYTTFIENKQCNSAKQFLKLCLRSFCVLSEYEDEPIYLDFEPDFKDENVNSIIKDNENKIESYKNELKEYDNLAYDEKVSKIKEDCLKELNYYTKLHDEGAKLNTRYDKFIEAIDDWNCSEDFEPIKEFAIIQCKISKENLDFYKSKIANYKRILNCIETGKYYTIQYEIDKYKDTIIENIKSCQDYIVRIKAQYEEHGSKKEFYNRFIKEVENVKF